MPSASHASGSPAAGTSPGCVFFSSLFLLLTRCLQRMGAPHIGVPFNRAGLLLLSHWIRAACSLYKHRGVAARLHFQGSRGRACTGLLLALPCLHQDSRGELASEQPYLGDFDVLKQLSPQALLYQPSYMTPRRPSVLGARTRL
ncbi:hypothetical protein NDU88_005388 [Pleurodeles waltl]|uniref:Secreted protein n=1 Tax=Pleurodeles waltl TaxID=8319 RepID=A0AAV7RNY3_PLEWA|nr:hypothetical protein NDU88_005388 [Pleurodeles waltl]